MGTEYVSRRRLLASLGATILGGGAGCSSTTPDSPQTTDGDPGEGGTTAQSADGDNSAQPDKETTAEGSGPDDFVGVDGTAFTLGDGSFYVSGAEVPPGYAYSLTHPIPELIRTITFDILDRIGATVVRTHAYDYAPVELGTPFPGEDNEEFFERMDRFIVEAKRRDIRLSVIIVNAAPHYHIDPAEQFGMHVPAFVHRADSADEINDFFENDECIRLYKQWVDELLTRENHITGVEYRNDPTIMMWELGNEIERYRHDGDPSIRSWVEEVAPYIQDVMNGNQLVTTGEHGWPAGRSDFIDDHAPDSIDVCSAHFWPDPAHYDLPDEEERALFDRLVTGAHETLEKPLWIGEYNWGYPDHDAPEEIDAEFITERNEKLTEWHDWMAAADVAGATLHVLDSKEIHEEHFGHDHRGGYTNVYGDADTGTVAELRRYAELTRDKSTASAVPELPSND